MSVVKGARVEGGLRDSLVSIGLAVPSDGPWVGMDPKLGSIYLAVLADAMARSEVLSPATDDPRMHSSSCSVRPTVPSSLPSMSTWPGLGAELQAIAEVESPEVASAHPRAGCSVSLCSGPAGRIHPVRQR